METAWLQDGVAFFQTYGLWGLLAVAFLESFISPILPDLLLIPMALANPEQAIWYAVWTTLTSVLGGFIGYYGGHRFGEPALRRIVPERHLETSRCWMEKYGALAVFLAAMSPIPYKFVSIIAGAFRVNLCLFFVFSFLGRSKRFLVEGLLIYYYGSQALAMFEKYKTEAIIGFVLVSVLMVLGVYLFRRHKMQARVAVSAEARRQEL